MRTLRQDQIDKTTYRLMPVGQVFLVVILISIQAFATDPQPSEQMIEIHSAIEKATQYLVNQQQPDGTWRSSTYGLLKDETSLTSLVMWSLPYTESTRKTRDRGLALMSSWLAPRTHDFHVIAHPQYPAYTGGLTICVLSRLHRDDELRQIQAWENLLVSHQLTEGNHWSLSDDQYGGWGYSHDIPVKPDPEQTLSPLGEPNLSATVFALEGLMAPNTRIENLDEIRFKALRFVMRCQNWRENSPASDSTFNDGGFHYVLADGIRNKPGFAGIDSTGQTRFLSYGSATADGLRALLLCGLKSHHPRVVAARNWLNNHVREETHSGIYPADRVHLKPSLDYYYMTSLARTLSILSPPKLRPSEESWLRRISQRLIHLQRENGSWSNPSVDVREDDPLVATPFALKTLQICLNQLRKISD